MQRNEVTKHLGNTNMDAYVDVLEILPPYARPDDNNKGSPDDKNKDSPDDKRGGERRNKPP